MSWWTSTARSWMSLRVKSSIFFVASRDAGYANPLYGWSQGHYRVRAVRDERDGRTKQRIYTEDGRPVLALEAERGALTRGLSGGVAQGITVGARGESGALDCDEFKDALRSQLPSAQ